MSQRKKRMIKKNDLRGKLWIQHALAYKHGGFDPDIWHIAASFAGGSALDCGLTIAGARRAVIKLVEAATLVPSLVQ